MSFTPPNVNPSPAPSFRGWSPRTAFDRMSTAKDRYQARQVQTYVQKGFAPVTTPNATSGSPTFAQDGGGGNVHFVTGEGTLPISFPYPFTEKPVFTYGHELAANQNAVAGAFPQLTATVLAWQTSGRHNDIYDGCTLGFVVSGSPNQTSVLHYQFNGMALVPVAAAYNDTGSA